MTAPAGPGAPARGWWHSPLLLMALTTLFWGGNQTIGKVASFGFVPPFALSFWRWVLAAIIVAALFWKSARETGPRLKGHWPFVVFLSVISVTYFNTAQYWALAHTSAISAGVILASMPAAIFLANALFGTERATPVQIAGAAASMLGVALVATRGSLDTLVAARFNAGDVASLSAVVTWAIYSVLFKRLPKGLDQRGLLVWMTVIGTVFILPFYLWEVANLPAMRLSAEGIGMILYTAVFASVLAYLFWNRAVEIGGANLAGVMFNLTPVFVVILAVTLLGERPAWYQGAGLALIFLGIYLAVIRGKLGAKPARDA